MHDLVVSLYLGNWESSVAKAAALVSADQTLPVVRALTANAGWRERVVAAKIICAFDLKSEVDTLIKTFNTNPESHTANAFSHLLSSLPESDAAPLLKQMRQACPATAYGESLLRIIEKNNRHGKIET
jgi:hypothetical protein